MLRRLTRLLTGALLAIALAMFLGLGVGPHLLGYRTLTVLSRSMEPTFSAGDVIVVTKARRSSVREGDVITYRAPIDGRPVVTHRVVDVLRAGRNPVVRTRGDANPVDDAWDVELDEGALWKQRLVLPAVGKVLVPLREVPVRAVLVWVIPWLLVAVAVADVLDAVRRPAAAPLEEGWQ